jgi:quercetin dioxygenase-like cupin family protein
MRRKLGQSIVASVGVIAVLFVTLGIVHSQQAASKTQRFPQFDNEDVKVWKSVVMPNAPLAMHRHDHPRIIIALSGGTIKIVDQSGAAEQHIWETGKAYWLPANPPNTMHADVNAGDKPLEVMVVELEKEK